MPGIILFDQEIREQLFPLAQTRHVAQIRVGILTIQEKWEKYLGQEIQLASEESADLSTPGFSASILPSRQFIESIATGHPDYEQVKILQYPWHIFQWNDWSIRQDFELVTANRHSGLLPSDVICRNPENVFVEEGAAIAPCFINALSGPIYIGKNAVIMDGAMIQGPIAICEGAVVKMGAKIYGASTIGPFCTVGGEIKNSVLLGYSNKAHDGYLGDSVIGEWCNLGAGCTNSNVKNTAGPVKMWNPFHKEFLQAGNKCGLVMGDYSRAGINTTFNTGTMVGIAANVFGTGISPKYIPSFSWGMDSLEKASFERSMDHIANWKKFKQKELTTKEIQQLRYIFDQY